MLKSLNTLRVLMDARAIIAKPGAWTQGHYARDANGEACGTMSATATCFCAGGAMLRADQHNVVGIALIRPEAAFKCFRAASGDDGVASVNDAPGMTQAGVVAIFDDAIENADPTGIGQALVTLGFGGKRVRA